MKMNVRQDGEVVVIEMGGRFAFSTHRDFRKKVDELLGHGSKKLIVDLSHVEFIDSSALGMLLMAREQARLIGGSLALVNPAGYVRKILDLAQFQRIFPILSSVDEAVVAVSGVAAGVRE
ncbi:MAG: STAS domain-containing protein [Nitrospirota bacterium]